MSFFRFPQTPHIAWLGKNEPRDDKLLSSMDRQHLLASDIVVEEKLDGANLGISFNKTGQLQVQNRGEYLISPYIGQFAQLNNWLAQYETRLHGNLIPNLILFGEWCAAKHSLDYQILPDWFLLFDVYDKNQQAFWSVKRRNQFAKTVGLHTVPQITSGKFTLKQLADLLSTHKSHYRDGKMEGIIIRRDSEDWCEQRAKLVRADFTQSIEEHWSRRPLEWNRVDWSKNQRHM